MQALLWGHIRIHINTHEHKSLAGGRANGRRACQEALSGPERKAVEACAASVRSGEESERGGGGRDVIAGNGREELGSDRFASSKWENEMWANPIIDPEIKVGN